MDKYKKHYFRIKGEKAEGVIHNLAQKSFLIDWCFLNPVLPGGKELCDLLIVFGDIAIIWQIKDLKIDKEGKHKKKDVEKNLRQLYGARRQLFALKTEVTLENPRRGKEVFNPATIKQIYLISALVGESEEAFSFVEEYKKNTIHVFNKEFTEIILNELDTISDFTKYLQAKEDLICQDKKIIINGGEEDLLAEYLMNDRSFSDYEVADIIMIDSDGWNHLGSKPEYKAKQEANDISYGWDDIINSVPVGQELLSRELARPNRFERRCLSELFYQIRVGAYNVGKRYIAERVFVSNDTTYCFLCCDDPTGRVPTLGCMCYIARGLFKKNKKVIGIATHKKITPICPYDYFFLELPEWNIMYPKNWTVS